MKNSRPPLISVSIVEDRKAVANSLSRMINESGIARIANVYYDLKSCREGLSKEPPDGILLLDVELPDGNGIDFCAEISGRYPALKIIILTSYREFNIARHALHNGALGYILKNAEPEELFAGIETVNRGEQFLCEATGRLLKENKGTNAIWLTNSEKTVLKNIADGYTTKEIAGLIFRDTETVKAYRRNLLIKFKAGNTAELVKKGYEMKMIR
jgi:DNA-binding NarL/FixJ family response regulator